MSGVGPAGWLALLAGGALLGSFNSYTEATARPRGLYMFTNFEFYAQDAWRVKPNLLVDYDPGWRTAFTARLNWLSA